MTLHVDVDICPSEVMPIHQSLEGIKKLPNVNSVEAFCSVQDDVHSVPIFHKDVTIG